MAGYGIDTRASRRSPPTSPAIRMISPNFACRVDVKVAGVWRECGPQPRNRETFKFSVDPQLEAKFLTWSGFT